MKDFANIPSLPFLFDKGASDKGASDHSTADTAELEQMIAQGATMLRAMIAQAEENSNLPQFPMDRDKGQSMLSELPKTVGNQVDYYFLRNQQAPATSSEPQSSSAHPSATGRSAMLSGASAFNVHAVRKDFP